MRNKILIVDANIEEREQLEQILQSVVEEGGELFFAHKREDGIAVLNKEHPQLVFLDEALVGDEEAWVCKDVHIILMGNKNEIHQKSDDFVSKPFKPYQVLEKCRTGLNHMPSAQIPPM